MDNALIGLDLRPDCKGAKATPVKDHKIKRAAKALEKSPAVRPVVKYVLRLFVAGATTRSRDAVLRIQELCAGELHGGCDLKVIDIYQRPKMARANQIVATPTLIVEYPPPVRRLIGIVLAQVAGLAGSAKTWIAKTRKIAM